MSKPPQIVHGINYIPTYLPTLLESNGGSASRVFSSLRTRSTHKRGMQNILGINSTSASCPTTLFSYIFLPVSLSISSGELLAPDKEIEQGANARTHKGGSYRLWDVTLPGLRVACCYVLCILCDFRGARFPFQLRSGGRWVCLPTSCLTMFNGSR